AEGDDRLVELVAADPDRLGRDDPAERDHRHLRGAAADVDDHVAGRLVYREPGADGGRHRLLDDVHPPRSGLMAGFLDRALLDSGNAAGNRDDNARLGEPAAPVHLLNEIPEHSLGHVEVGNYSVFQRSDRNNISGSPADHSLSFKADRDNLAGISVKRDYRGFIEDDPAASYVHERVGSAEVDGHVTAKKGQRVA